MDDLDPVEVRNRARDALDSSGELLARLEAERPARERRQWTGAASAAATVPPAPSSAPRPPERVSAAERRGRRDWPAEAVWINQLIDARIAAGLVPGIGQAIAEVRAEIEAAAEKRVEALRVEYRAALAATLGDILRDVTLGLAELRREITAGMLNSGVSDRLARLDRLFEMLAQRELGAWEIDATPAH